jgi:hypothetical protein
MGSGLISPEATRAADLKVRLAGLVGKVWVCSMVGNAFN